MSCAKAKVTATLTTVDGGVYVGTNDCKNPQPACPREPGEDYTKCREICKQTGHAETQAIYQAVRSKANLEGGQMVVQHKRVCSLCQKAMLIHGIEWELAQ